MMSIKNIALPDIGDFDEVEVIEILVNIGDKISTDDSIITLESDKASMEIPSPFAGIVTKIEVNIGDKIKQGCVILSVESTDVEKPKTPAEIKIESPTSAPIPTPSTPTPIITNANQAASTLPYGNTPTYPLGIDGREAVVKYVSSEERKHCRFQARLESLCFRSSLFSIF